MSEQFQLLFSFKICFKIFTIFQYVFPILVAHFFKISVKLFQYFSIFYCQQFPKISSDSLLFTFFLIPLTKKKKKKKKKCSP